MDTEVDAGDVSLLCDISGGLRGPLDSSSLKRVIGLIAKGLIKRDPDPGGGSRLRLTEKGYDAIAGHSAGDSRT